MNTRIVTAAVIALALANSARAVPIQYEFTAVLDQVGFTTFDPVPTAIQDALLSIRGQTLTGSFFYDSEAPLLYTIPSGTAYNNAVSGLTASFAGSHVVGANATPSAGVAMVLDGPPQDRLSLSSSLSGDTLLGYELRNVGISWVQGVPQFDPIPDFLTGNSLPTELPVDLSPQISINLWIPGLAPINPIINFNANFSAYQGTVRRVAVPEPATSWLALAGLLAAGLARRRGTARSPERA